MSFSTDIKQEIANNDLNKCCIRAQLSAIIQLCSTLNISKEGLALSIKTENATVAKRIYKLIKELYEVDVDLSIIKKMNLKKNNIYHLKVRSKATMILEDIGLWSSRALLERPLKKIVSKECCARAYLAGAFMATGSCNTPKKSDYHLEVVANNEQLAHFIVENMERFFIHAKIIKRRNNYVVYVKMADKIADFLRCVGASESLLKFEDIRISRDFTNSLTRLDNCEVANEIKSQKAAKAQLEDIQKIADQLDRIDTKLQEVARLRLANPEMSLNELCAEYEKNYGVAISKSGIKHRFVKIAQLANKEN
ncbi:MAG: DNA-binding protein WhiA [Erysipelotrichaceae bacterium]|nr:DNA-binding protein WhiA [Erysipelotrichaceae bacterium]MDY5252940.1 DNA-binding protein WhiA [Erysipelotrichaceae bacterium]